MLLGDLDGVSVLHGLEPVQARIAPELGTSPTRRPADDRTPPGGCRQPPARTRLTSYRGVAECDEVDVVAGPKGHPNAVHKGAKSAGGAGRARVGAATPAAVVVRRDPHAGERPQRLTSDDLARRSSGSLRPGTRVYTNKYTVDHRFAETGFRTPSTAGQDRGDAPRREDGPGF